MLKQFGKMPLGASLILALTVVSVALIFNLEGILQVFLK